MSYAWIKNDGITMRNVLKDDSKVFVVPKEMTHSSLLINTKMFRIEPAIHCAMVNIQIYSDYYRWDIKVHIIEKIFFTYPRVEICQKIYSKAHKIINFHYQYNSK